MSGLLLDTHVWLWFLEGSPRLPESLATRIGRAVDRCWLSPISIWEAGLLHDRKRIRIRGEYRGWLQEARRQFPWREAAVNSEVAVTSLEVELPHRDPADRILAATALVYQLELATLDTTLIAADWLPTLPA